MSRQTSERVVWISCASLVPLTTTVAFALSTRITRDKRSSVRAERKGAAGSAFAPRVGDLLEIGALWSSGKSERKWNLLLNNSGVRIWKFHTYGSGILNKFR